MLSVVILTFNSEKYLKEALESAEAKFKKVCEELEALGEK